jgi:hypothetical protein
MNSRSKFHETVTRQENGKTIIGVMISNTPRVAWLDEADYLKIVATYGISSWFLNATGNGKAYVRFRNGGNNRTVARVILNGPMGAQVRLLDGDPYNLRRSNLYISADERVDRRRKEVAFRKPQAVPVSSLRIPSASANG